MPLFVEVITNIKRRGISKSLSTNIEFEEYHNCFCRAEHRKRCDAYVLRSINHGMYLERVCKFVSVFEEKRCYLNEYESIT